MESFAEPFFLFGLERKKVQNGKRFAGKPSVMDEADQPSLFLEADPLMARSASSTATTESRGMLAWEYLKVVQFAREDSRRQVEQARAMLLQAHADLRQVQAKYRTLMETGHKRPTELPFNAQAFPPQGGELAS